MTRSRAAFLMLGISCGPSVSQTESGSRGSSGEGTTEATSSATSTAGHTSSTSDVESSSSTGAPPESQICGTNFPEQDCDHDWARRNSQACNWWVDDCGPDAACQFVDPGVTACVSLASEPRGIYESCTMDGQECRKDMFCNGSECVPRCTCSPERPHCGLPNTTCESDPVAIAPVLCSQICDLVDPACPEQRPVCFTLSVPQCALPGSGSMELPVGEPCSNDGPPYCAEGTYCTTGAPNCKAETCCAPFCRLDDAEPCVAYGFGFECTPISDAPACWENFGVCRKDG